MCTYRDLICRKRSGRLFGTFARRERLNKDRLRETQTMLRRDHSCFAGGGKAGEGEGEFCLLMPFYHSPWATTCITRLRGHIVCILCVFAQFPVTRSVRRERANCLWDRSGRGTRGGWGAYTRIRLGCRFIGRKILDLLISLVRHVGFVLLPARNLPRASGWRADTVFVSGFF